MRAAPESLTLLDLAIAVGGLVVMAVAVTIGVTIDSDVSFLILPWALIVGAFLLVAIGIAWAVVVGVRSLRS